MEVPPANVLHWLCERLRALSDKFAGIARLRASSCSPCSTRGNTRGCRAVSAPLAARSRVDSQKSPVFGQNSLFHISSFPEPAPAPARVAPVSQNSTVFQRRHAFAFFSKAFLRRPFGIPRNSSFLRDLLRVVGAPPQGPLSAPFGHSSSGFPPTPVANARAQRGRSAVEAKVAAERWAALPQTRESKPRVERRPQQGRQLSGFSPQRAQNRGNIRFAVGAHARDRRMRQGSFDRIGNDSYRGEGRAMPGGQPRRDMRLHVDGDGAGVRTQHRLVATIRQGRVGAENYRVRRRPDMTLKSEGRDSWTDDEVAQFEARWPVGTPERLAFDVLLFAGLRRGDAVRCGRRRVRDGVFRFRAERTASRSSRRCSRRCCDQPRRRRPDT